MEDRISMTSFSAWVQGAKQKCSYIERLALGEVRRLGYTGNAFQIFSGSSFCP
jgi:hypothetical protein